MLQRQSSFLLYTLCTVFSGIVKGLKNSCQGVRGFPSFRAQRWNPSAPVKETKLFPLMFPVFTSYAVFGIVYSPHHPFSGARSESECTCLKFPLFPSFPCVSHSGVFPGALRLLCPAASAAAQKPCLETFKESSKFTVAVKHGLSVSKGTSWIWIRRSNEF